MQHILAGVCISREAEIDVNFSRLQHLYTFIFT